MTSTVTEETKSLLRAALDNAFRAGAEAMREACATYIDCNNCKYREQVLANFNDRPSQHCPSGWNCNAYAARRLRNLSLHTMPQETPDA